MEERKKLAWVLVVNEERWICLTFVAKGCLKKEQERARTFIAKKKRAFIIKDFVSK